MDYILFKDIIEGLKLKIICMDGHIFFLVLFLAAKIPINLFLFRSHLTSSQLIFLNNCLL